MVRSYRVLIWFWTVALSASAVGAVTLQIFGPLPSRVPRSNAMHAAESSPPALPKEPFGNGVAPTDSPAAPASAAASNSTADDEPDRAALASSTPVVAAPPQGQRAQRSERKNAAEALNARAMRRERSSASPQGDAPPQPSFARNPPAPTPAYQPVTGYIGVYTTGADGMRTFRSNP